MEKAVDQAPESALVARLKRRSPEAFEELVALHARRLQSVAMGILHNAQDAEDCVQETFLKAFQSISGFRGKASLSTWLYRITTNLALSQLRKERRNRVVDMESDLPAAHDRHPASVRDCSSIPETALLGRELADQVQKLINQLPEHYRKPYILKDLEKRTEAEVSRTLGLSKSAIKCRAHRARVFVRSRLEKRRLGPAPSNLAASVWASLDARSVPAMRRNHG